MHFPPYYEITDQGEASGTYVDLIKEVLKPTGLKYSFMGYPNARFYQYLQSGEFDLFFGSTKGNSEIEPNLIYSSKPLKDNIELRIYSRHDDADDPKEKPTKISDLYGKSTIVIHGFRYSGLLKPLETIENRKNIFAVQGHKAGLKMLTAGRAYYLLDYRGTTEKHLQMLGEENFDYETVLSIPVYMMIHKDYPNAQQTMQTIEENYWKLISDRKQACVKDLVDATQNC